MSKKAKIFLHPGYVIGEISPRLYGAFLEPIGTMVNGSMFNPKHPTADEDGFRRDWIDELKKCDLPALRLPGGNFVSCWEWKDSIGPKEQRKKHLDLAWHQYITNEVGHDEYLKWAEHIGAEPMYTVNLGTERSIKELIHIIEYTNHEGGTYWSDLRKEYGREKPYGVKMWYLGNEMDGPWQLGSWERDPKGYGILCNEVSKAMKWVDGSIETAVCGSSAPFMEHFPQWDYEVMSECYNAVDYLSIHHYHHAAPGNYAQLLGGAEYYEDFINTEIAMCDFVQAKNRSPKKMMISFDEYGAMMHPLGEIKHPAWGPYNMYDAHYRFDPDRGYVLHDPDNMNWFRRRSDGKPMPGDMMNALANASIILAFMRHADRVKIGCMTGGLNTLVSTSKETVWRSGAHYPFHMLSQLGRGVSLKPYVECDTFDIPEYVVDETSKYPEKKNVRFIDVAVAHDPEKGELNIFAINRDTDNTHEFELDVANFEGYTLKEHITLYDESMLKRNSPENPEELIPSADESTSLCDGKIVGEFKPLSWNVIRLVKE